MTKNEFLSSLRGRLYGLPEADIEKSLEYYSEMIDDRIEDGMTEEAAVADIGSIDEIVSGIISDTSLQKLVREKVKPKHSLRGWEIALIVLGSPVWVSLAFAAVMVLLAFYLLLWAAVAVLFAAVLAFGCSVIAALVGMITFFAVGNAISGVFMLGMCAVCAGFAILTVLFSGFIAKKVAVCGKKIILGIKRCFVGKEK